MTMRRKGSVVQSMGKWYTETADGFYGPFEDRQEALAVLHPRAALWAFALFWIGVIAAVMLLSLSAFGQSATAPVPKQTWFKVATEGASITTSDSITYRFGTASGIADNNVDCAKTSCWSAPTVQSSQWTNFLVYFKSFPFADPAPDVVKELDVLETATAQTVTVTPVGGLPIVLIVPADPALAPSTPIPVLPSTTASFTPGSVYDVTVSKLQPRPGSLAQVLLQRLPVSANVVIGGVLSGFSFDITVNGITLECLYGNADAAGNVMLSCIAPTPAVTN